MSSLRKLAFLEDEMRERLAVYMERQEAIQRVIKSQEPGMREFYEHERAKVQGRIEELSHLIRLLEDMT
jgi:hypothetical protein